jgi:hypothetical protein
MFSLIRKPGYQFAERGGRFQGAREESIRRPREFDFKAPERGPVEGPGRSILRLPAWVDFEALERVRFSGPSVSLGINVLMEV